MIALRLSGRFLNIAAALLLVSGPLGMVLAEEIKVPTEHANPSDTTATSKVSDTNPTAAIEPAETDVLTGIKSGQLTAKAEGREDGRITISITNRTKRPLRVILPPGLVATGATGQFGGMGGMGGGMGMMGGGMGMMGGGMGGGMGMMGGGMGGGMGMMGGGMGMRGGGMGMRGGGMGMMSGGTMPASMGMMMLGRLIMSLIGDRDSWDQRSLMMGMMMMGGMGMRGGMMGGGMGMMGGGMGGGFRSVPPTGLPEAVLKPGQTRHLPTRVVNLNGPDGEGAVSRPVKGEILRIGGVDQTDNDPQVALALKRLAAEKAPQTVSQLVMWRIVGGLEWPAIANLSQSWANVHELTLARAFVERLGHVQVKSEKGTTTPDDPARFFWNLSGDDPALASIRTLLDGRTMLGLKATRGVPSKPSEPALACEAQVSGSSTDAVLDVRLAVSAPDDLRWVASGRCSIPLYDASKKRREPAEILNTLAEEVLNRVVKAKLAKGPHVKGQLTYTITISNGSPLVLNGLALGGSSPDGAASEPSMIAGLSVPPHKTLKVPATAKMVDRLKLTHGIRMLAADLSGL